MKRPQRVSVLIDWNSQLHYVGSSALSEEEASSVLRSVCQRVGRLLVKVAPDENFELHLRAYYGWYRGFEPTQGRRAVMAVSMGRSDVSGEGQGLLGYSAQPESVIVRQLQFGDKLLFARDARLYEGLDCHLPGTLQREQDGDKEKMVDTALASDLCYLAFKGEDWIIVVGQDRDLVPPLYVAEAAMMASSRRLFFLTTGRRIKNLKLEGLLWR